MYKKRGYVTFFLQKKIIFVEKSCLILDMVKSILQFLSDLKQNNNRDWFSANKSRYEAATKEFELLGNRLITEISTFDSSIKNINAKECIFRIYRDIRFSHDKTPYKTNFGIYIAYGGKKSRFGGYYLHLDPEQSFFGCGVWMPYPNELKMLRQSIFDNIDEFCSIIQNTQFKRLFPELDEEGKLKKTPAGFPADFPQADLLRYKSFLVSCPLTSIELKQTTLVNHISELGKVGYPFVSFLNYALNEEQNNRLPHRL